MDKKEVQALRMKTILSDIDEANQRCADCERESMDYASINNGTIICEECSKEHRELGTSLSFLRSFYDKWDDYLLNFIRTGGNSRFIIFAKSYNISKMKISEKYKTRACEYYRDILRSEVLGYDPPDNINVNTANEVLTVIPDYYPEFQNYSFVKHIINLDKYEKKEPKEQQKEETGLFGTFKSFFSGFGKKVDSAKEMISNKVAGLSVKEKILGTGSQAIDVMKIMTENAKEKIQGMLKDEVKEKEDAKEGKEKENESKIENVNKEKKEDNKLEDKKEKKEERDKVEDNKEIVNDKEDKKEEVKEKKIIEGGEE